MALTGQALGIIEAGSWSVGMVAVDVATKAADVRVLVAELNDMLGVCVRVAGDVADVQAAVAAAKAWLDFVNVSASTSVIAGPDPAGAPAYLAKPEYNALIEK